jgi:hypothetical protein
MWRCGQAGLRRAGGNITASDNIMLRGYFAAAALRETECQCAPNLKKVLVLFAGQFHLPACAFIMAHEIHL